MMLSTILMAGQTLASGIQASQSSKTAKKIGKIQAQMAKDDLMFNKSQLNEYYNSAYMANMTQYAQGRADKAQEFQEVASNINTQISAQGVNLSDSSVKDDMNNRMDSEYEIGMQNMLTNQLNDLSTIASNVAMQDYQINKQYQDQLYGIDQAVQQAQNQAWDKVFQNLGNTLVSAAQGIDATHTQNKYLNPKEASLKNSMKEYFTSFTGFTTGVR